MDAEKNLVLSGNAGIGKTTLIKEAALPFRGAIGGFYTEELRADGARLGFKLVTFDGREATLASKALATSVRLNKYGVDVDALDRVGVDSLARAREERRLVVIDEIGAMEALSPAFREACMSCLRGPQPVLATIRRGANEFADEVKRLPGTRVVELSRENFEDVRREVRAWLESRLGPAGSPS